MAARLPFIWFDRPAPLELSVLLLLLLLLLLWLKVILPFGFFARFVA
ncbi:MAG: hypothetical protein J7L26_08265 [Candidatus Aminicenantes bacterium]|nr:hypothetical protein [Candidatus Aminicenantes bacterium]